MSYWESNGKTSEWYTPKYVFDALGCEFDLDVAHPGKFDYCCVPAKHFYTVGSLHLNWFDFVWMNPPFGGRNGIVPWLDKFIEHRNGIALTPDRTSTTWWQNIASKSDAIFFVHGKIPFIREDGTIGDQPGNGTTLFGFGDKAIQAFKNASDNKLGMFILK